MDNAFNTHVVCSADDRSSSSDEEEEENAGSVCG
jgi:hypothetical protein